jgi:hypothetical protein
MLHICISIFCHPPATRHPPSQRPVLRPGSERHPGAVRLLARAFSMVEGYIKNLTLGSDEYTLFTKPKIEHSLCMVDPLLLTYWCFVQYLPDFSALIIEVTKSLIEFRCRGVSNSCA